ncbi:MAG: protoporphyrinogen oxidase [Balneolales bacterium]
MSIAIIGAGITGLTLALELTKKGHAVRVFEASSQVGGVIQTHEEKGWKVECGPNSILESSKRITALVRDLDLSAEVTYTARAAEKRYVVRKGEPALVPGSALQFLKSNLLSNKSKFKILKEPFVKPLPGDEEENLADFIRRRLGEEVLDYFVYPFVGGIYSGDPEKLSVKYAFKRFYSMEKKYGSIILGQFKAAGERADHEIAKNKALSFSFKNGLGTLPEALHRKLGEAVKVNARVVSVAGKEGSFEVLTESSGIETRSHHRAVVYSGPAHSLDKLNFRLRGSAAMTDLSEIPYPPVLSVALGFRRRQVDHPLDGFGILIPQKEDFSILGVQFNSTVFPDRTPDADHVLLTTFVGGTRHPELTGLSDARVTEIIMRDLELLLGIKGNPAFIRHTRWANAIPQYEVGYGKFLDLMESVEKENPGFYFAGNYRTGIAVGDCISSSVDLAERITQDFPAEIKNRI